MSLNAKRILLSILIVLFLTVCVATFWSLLKSYRLRSTPEFNHSARLVSNEGWKIHRSYGNTTIYEGSIDSYHLERATLGPFAIGPLHVARLQRVMIDFYLEGLLYNSEPEKHPSTKSNPGSGKDLSKRSNAGPEKHPSTKETFRIDTLQGPLADIQKGLFYRSRTTTILEINGICLNLWAGKKRVFRISSDHATIDRQTGDVVFVGHASLDAAENGSIISHRITWVKKTSLFRIKDHFILTKADETKEGRELETDYQLKTMKYRTKG